MRRILIIIVVVLLVFLAIVVGSRNTDVITINYLIAQTELRISTFMVISVLVGFFLGFVTLLSKYLSLRLQLSLAKRKLKKLSKEE
ncbi:lipopolysaccharide assembly protein LapA domain-containing protein [Agaribacter flavus]|uniref:Probable lipopolysaccharide assembly protein A n=1 Tax=Agaribacter flavus TaxID=1902781 RepID=A0ABV7FR43_9ALTE